MVDSVMSTPMKSFTVSLTNAVSHESNNNSKNTCYSCVDDYSIPPCAGFSQDYSCLPDLGVGRGSNRKT